MNSSLSRWATLLLAILLVSCNAENATNTPDDTNTMTPSEMYGKLDLPQPEAAKKPHEMTIHGDTRVDDYYWMKLTDEQKNAEDPDEQTTEVLAYLNAENDYFDQMTAHMSDLKETIFQEIKGRIKETDESVPYKVRDYYYITRYEEGKEYPIYSRKAGSLDADEEIMMDVNEMAEGHDYYALGGNNVSMDNRYVAFGVDTVSRRQYTIRVKDLQTGEMLNDVIPNTTGGSTWSNDGQYLFYTVKEPVSLRSYRIYRHKIGTPTQEDVMIFEEEDETFSAFVYKSKSDKYLILGSYQTLSTEFQILEADNPTGEFRMFQPRERGLEYGIAHYGDKFYIRTNLDAKNFQLMSTPETATTKDNWETVIGNRDDVLLEGIDIFKDYLVVSERKAGLTNIRVMPWEGEEHYLEFNDPAYVAGTSANPEFDTDVLRYRYQSLTTPSTVYDYNMNSKEQELLKQQEVLGGFDASEYQSERIMAKARDGAEVPVSIVYKKGTPKDGSAPLLLYAYGSYGYSMDPSFSISRLSLLDRGFIYAIAHIRGGEEMGRNWYEDGKMMNKMNTFTDFIDVGKVLVEKDYTQNDRLFAMGGSAGGLLMGAIINLAPDMWKGVVAAVPFVDVVTTMLDETIPLTTGEYDEWGNPNEEAAYKYMLSYSPYDNVEAKDYPAMLVTTGLHDSQVQYWEPAKWVAKLREMKTDQNPLLMHTNMEAGHGGASGRFKRLREVARDYAFFVDLAGKGEVNSK
ncbi:oligopeptidase B [Lewinellaceae bacterium SD302]|nr:oligopeptidase B [Lewinellaceae bacterium SD302]